MPMKKNDALAVKFLKPKKETIDFLLNFSRNLHPMKVQNQETILVSKN